LLHRRERSNLHSGPGRIVRQLENPAGHDRLWVGQASTVGLQPASVQLDDLGEAVSVAESACRDVEEERLLPVDRRGDDEELDVLPRELSGLAGDRGNRWRCGSSRRAGREEKGGRGYQDGDCGARTRRLTPTVSSSGAKASTWIHRAYPSLAVASSRSLCEYA
jgi:hypothetical protein